ncbi:exopolyphosphatase [Vulcanimicrobium alpinum]|uniref:Exopolyphosphatase n=1 Tax=Vulcanimicrobium alpinum TaxID=3016050 RepID=A0AAN1XX65_UNVUL|nr:Ppx/GppA phosphatase family protein [Vulcanimicrobium alpinum]BDE06994.1 exopolyphosphatase [Vulcanimicrobium alpinum]
MLFGAIDVGTNSIHLIVVELDAAFDTSRVVYKAREMVRLGSDDALEHGRLTRKAMERGVDAIARFAEAAHERGADRVRAVATSAVRETANGGEFRDLVEARTGVRLEILDGAEEARLIHLGVANGYPLYDRVACIIDIGGGSTEFVVADGERPYLVDSVKLGSLRLYDAYLRGRPDPLRAARKLDAHVTGVLAPLTERIRHYRIDLALGTSGTIMGLAALDAAARGLTVKRVHGYTLSRLRLETLQRKMLVMTEADRRRMPGMNPRRADIIVAGNAVLIAALSLLGRDEIVVCERALRDGVVVDLAHRDRLLAERLGDERAARLDAVERLAQRYEHLGGHQRHVARLALVLFERLAPLHGLAPGDRDLLWAAAILHGIGRFVSDSGHHKHAAYLIRSTPLPGWRDEERLLVAQIARYYRKAMPKPTHLDYAALDAPDRRRVDMLAALLRIADGLDIRHLGLVNDVAAGLENGIVHVTAQADGDVSDELDAATAKADLFERAFGVRVALDAVVPATLG